jgi:hypothetical protein
VSLGELGRAYRPNGANANTSLNERAKSLMAANPGMTYGDAVERVAAEDPRMFNDYRADVMELD